MLDVELGREGPPPKDAATILCIRDTSDGRLEVLCVERAKASGFLGGAIVFPGGKLDAGDRDARLTANAKHARAATPPIAADDATRAALAVAACRESFEEAGILLHVGAPLAEAERRALRERLAKGVPFAELIAERGITLDLASLTPFARWVTPAQETRRFDTRFYLARAPHDQEPVHDAHETTSAFWSSPHDVLARFERGECQLFPPTHRSLEILATATSVDHAMAAAERAALEIICPELVRQVAETSETLALVLPGDPEHSIREARVPGRSRYVLRGERWLPEAAPGASSTDQRPSR